jgi:hypothetical protein
MFIKLVQTERVFPKAPWSLVEFGKAYVSFGDTTGYHMTQAYLNGDYSHWQTLLKCLWFKEAKEAWDEELNAKLAAEGLKTIREIAKDEDHKGRLQAARILLQRGDASKIRSKGLRGRPSTEEVSGYLKEAAHAEKALQDDLERIQVVKGIV